MSKSATYTQIINKAETGKKQLALLIDPDKAGAFGLEHTLRIASEAGVDLIFVGGSLLTENHIRDCVKMVKDNTDVPVILFPGSPSQIHASADAIFLLSLISGRNADLLIGRHVEAAPLLKQSGLEIIPTGYMLIDAGQPTTASYISNTFPIPYNKPDIAACTAMAGEMLGLKAIYMDCGSGAAKPVSPEMIARVKSSINIPLIVGGGIRTKTELHQAFSAGADIAVVGNAVEKDPELLYTLGQVIRNPA
ncbi:MAG: phosphoglycerol geranylgeranyltransferase [Bacteroidia bacterium]